MRDSLRKARLDKGLSQRALAEQAGVHRTFYSKIEKGVRNPSYKTAANIAHVLKKRVDHLFPLDEYLEVEGRELQE